jgi:hypothetical protein
LPSKRKNPPMSVMGRQHSRPRTVGATCCFSINRAETNGMMHRKPSPF